MTKLSGLFLLFALVAVTHADVLIENVTQTIHLTGQGSERTLKLRNYVVADLDGTNGAAISTTILGGRKVYHISYDSTRVVSVTLRGLNGKVYRVITLGVTETNDTQVLKVEGILARGLNTALPVSDSRWLTYPRILRGSGHSLELVDGEYGLSETSYVRTYAQTDTKAANARGDDVSAVVARILQRLEKSGYVSAP